GITTIRVTFKDLVAETLVDVRATLGVPHFARNGQILTQFDPDRSLFIRSMFGLTSDEIQATSGLKDQVIKAGINTLTEGFYSNPGDSPQDGLTEWQASWIKSWETRCRVARSIGGVLYLTGDDIARTPTELNNSISNSWSADAIQFAFGRLRDSGLVVAVDMV